MNTALQLRRTGGEVRTGLLYGTPVETVAGTLGPVALFSSGEIVAYRIQHRRRTRVFVFRTLDVDDRLAASVPGVCPRVRLLLEVRTAGRAQLVRGLLAYLVKTGHDPCRLPDGFYVRVGVVLAGLLPAHKILRSLLSSSLGPDPPGGCVLTESHAPGPSRPHDHERLESHSHVPRSARSSVIA
jgi:hypothetical protein